MGRRLGGTFEKNIIQKKKCHRRRGIWLLARDDAPASTVGIAVIVILVCVRSTDAVAADRSFESVGSRISYKTGRRLQQIFLISTKEIFAFEISSFFLVGKEPRGQREH